MDRCRQAVVLAAGEGTRLRPLTESVPKCMVQVAGRPMLDRLFDHLVKMAVDEVVIVTGHLANVLQAHVDQMSLPFSVRYVHNEVYDRTNNVYSLWLARNEIDPPFILAESDLVLEAGLLEPLLTPDGMVVARWDETMSGTVVVVSTEGIVERLILKKDQGAEVDLPTTWKTVNFYSFSRATWEGDYLPALEATVNDNRLQDYYEAALGNLINAGRVRMRAVDVTGRRWTEIDNHDDLERAEALFAV